MSDVHWRYKERKDMNPQELYESYWAQHGTFSKKTPREGAIFLNEMTPEDMYKFYHSRKYGFGLRSKCGSYLRPFRES
jgi:hypothetical protein